jgi:hypothetical protein
MPATKALSPRSNVGTLASRSRSGPGMGTPGPSLATWKVAQRTARPAGLTTREPPLEGGEVPIPEIGGRWSRRTRAPRQRASDRFPSRGLMPGQTCDAERPNGTQRLPLGGAARSASEPPGIATCSGPRSSRQTEKDLGTWRDRRAGGWSPLRSPPRPALRSRGGIP